MYAKPTRVFTSTWVNRKPNRANSSVTKRSPVPSTNDGLLSRLPNNFMSLPASGSARGRNARVEKTNCDVDPEVGEQHAHRDQQRTAGDHRVVVALNGGEHGHAQARVTEDHLRDERARDHGPEREGQARELRQHGIAEHVK